MAWLTGARATRLEIRVATARLRRGHAGLHAGLHRRDRRGDARRRADVAAARLGYVLAGQVGRAPGSGKKCAQLRQDDDQEDGDCGGRQRR